MHRDEFTLAFSLIWLCLVWLAVIIMFVFLFAGCERQPIGQSDGSRLEQPTPEVPTIEKVPTLQRRVLEVDYESDIRYIEFEVAGCEYLYLYNGNGHLMHKPRCKGCEKEKS